MPATAPRLRIDRPASREAGVTIVELAVVLAILGLIGVGVTAGYSEAARIRASNDARADAESARQAIRAFVLRNKRLPCPDVTPNGLGAREGDAAGTCPAGAQIGWLPYESLGLTPPEGKDRMRYAVGRAGGADLVAPAALPGTPDLDRTGRLRAALGGAARLTPTTTRPFLTGAGSPASPENCTQVQSNPAFALVAPADDRDQQGAGSAAGFDGIHVSMATSNSLCIAAPARPAGADYDDVVVAESATALLGWLATQTR